MQCLCECLCLCCMHSHSYSLLTSTVFYIVGNFSTIISSLTLCRVRWKFFNVSLFSVHSDNQVEYHSLLLPLPVIISNVRQIQIEPKVRRVRTAFKKNLSYNVVHLSTRSYEYILTSMYIV